MKHSILKLALWGSILVVLPVLVFGQVTEIGGVGNIFQKRTEKKASSSKATPTPAPKASPTPAKPENAPAKPGAPAAGQTPAPPQAGARPGGSAPGKAPARPGGQPSAQAPANTGQLRVVTKALADSVKTRFVEYDEEALRTSGTAVILNPRRYRPENETMRGAQ